MAKQVIVKNGQVQGNNGQALSLQNLQPENIKKDVNIGGVVGNLSSFMRVEKTITPTGVTSFTIEDVPFTVSSFVIYSIGSPSNNSGYYALTHGQKDASYNVCFSHEISNHRSREKWNALGISQTGSSVTISVSSSTQFGVGLYVILLFS